MNDMKTSNVPSLPTDLYCTVSDDNGFVLWASADKFNMVEDINGDLVVPTAEVLDTLKGNWRPYFWAEMVDGSMWPMFFHAEDLAGYYRQYREFMSQERAKPTPKTGNFWLDVCEAEGR